MQNRRVVVRPAGFFVFFCRGQVLKKITYQFCADSLFQQCADFDDAVYLPGPCHNRFPNFNFASRLDGLPSNLHMPGRTCLRRQGPTLVKAHRPKPFVDSHAVHRRRDSIVNSGNCPVVRLPGRHYQEQLLIATKSWLACGDEGIP